mmetsp:Transcript_29735/g.53397  ORF Transcript_29735/g.53397 Transcript_29735/m.53397 type:complete len:94 (-) Transcript_29735:951-1232(-)
MMASLTSADVLSPLGVESIFASTVNGNYLSEAHSRVNDTLLCASRRCSCSVLAATPMDKPTHSTHTPMTDKFGITWSRALLVWAGIWLKQMGW